MKYKLLILLSAILLVGCEAELGINSKPSEEKLAQMEKRRTNLREEIQRLNIEKKGLEEAPSMVTNIVNVTTNVTQVITNVIVVTNFVSSFDVTPDGRITQRVLLIKVFNTDEVVSLPYSPHEFIVKNSNGIYHVSFNSSVIDPANIVSFKIFK